MLLLKHAPSSTWKQLTSGLLIGRRLAAPTDDRHDGAFKKLGYYPSPSDKNLPSYEGELDGFKPRVHVESNEGIIPIPNRSYLGSAIGIRASCRLCLSEVVVFWMFVYLLEMQLRDDVSSA